MYEAEAYALSTRWNREFNQVRENPVKKNKKVLNETDEEDANEDMIFINPDKMHSSKIRGKIIIIVFFKFNKKIIIINFVLKSQA